MESSPPILATHLVDATFCIQMACPQTVAWARRLGHDDIWGQNLFEVFDEFMNDEVQREYEAVLATGEVRHSTRRLSTELGDIITEIRKIPMLRYGKTAQILTVVHNITEQKVMEERLLQSRKLESLSVLAGGIAHDFNNLLGGIFGNLNLARRRSEEGHADVLRYLDRAMGAFERARHLSHQLLTFSKFGAPARQPIRLLPVCHEAMEAALSGSTMRCRLRLDDDLPLVNADRNQIRQVLVNLLFNARQAMPVGGKVTLSAETCQIVTDDRTGLPPGQYVRVTVQDNGPGIPEEILALVFDPFFSTKTSGSGLGLATAHSVVTQHGGVISVESSNETGTAVIFYLETTVAREQFDAAAPPPRQSMVEKRILLLEDDVLLQEVTREFLEALGWEVTAESVGDVAVTRYIEAKEAGQPFGLVIFDLTVEGGIGGQEAMARLRTKYPDICGIVTSGYADSPVLSNPEKFGFCARLVKPYQPHELRAALHEALSKIDTIKAS
ncbi:MAG: response regulator [Deltaproteobacteria bacterium]|nr:response regulator [Deltaproteobacteria bacterium]